MPTPSTTSTPRIQISLPRRNLLSSSTEERSNSYHGSEEDEEQEFDMPLPVAASGRNDEPGFTHYDATMPDHPRSPTTTSAAATTTTKASSPTSNLWDGLRNKNMDFPINTECTSLCLSPSGNFLWAGFSDGTLRVFDLCGRFSLQADESWENGGRQKSTMMLPSKFHQRFGAVACQIHARGVHTDLLMQVDMCGDYVFGGVPRGANELYAVSTRDLEAQAAHGNSYSSSTTANILDSIHVHVHADAKLKGFGACTQLQHASRPTYLLLTGKGIKNIHIWKFQPPLNNKNHEEEPVWEQLYDTQTNGNTISLLSFYRNPLGKLMGVSQSDTQKLRLWDLSREEQEDTTTSSSTTNSHCTSIKPRPKRPPYQDVANSQGALGIAGGYGVCGGPTMYNQLSIVSLDQPKSAYNHTELALPGASSAASSLSMGRGRQRRGDLKQVVNVATLPNDSNHALLELDDGSIVHYTATGPKAGRPNLEILSEELTGIAPLPADFWSRTICLGKPAGLIVAAVGMYNPNTQLGHIEVRSLQKVPPSSPMATDSRALSRLCMQAPPPSSLKKKLKKKKKRALEQMQGTAAEDYSGSSNRNNNKGDSARLTTPCRMEEEPSANTSTRPVPISVEQSTKKLKKKKNKSSNGSSNGATAIPPSIEKDVRGDTEPMQVDPTKKKSPPVYSSNEPSTKLSSSGAAILPSVSPATRISEEVFTFQKKKVVPISSMIKEAKTDSSSSIAPQVSPSASTPSARQVQGETPSSEESNKAEHGAIAKFLKPIRVLHNYPEHQDGNQQPVAKVASPPVPRKVRNTSDESQPDRTPAAPTSENETEAAQSHDTENTRVEFKVQKTLKIRLGHKTSDSSVNKRPETPTQDGSNDGPDHKRPRTESSSEHSLVNIASMLVDLKSPPSASRTNNRPKVSRNNSSSSLTTTREDLITTQAKELYQKLCQHIDSLPKPQSRLLSQSVDAFGSFAPQSRYTRVANEHRASHDMIQRRLLRSAEATLRSLVENHATVEGARSELKDAIRSYQEVLHDTLKRQELELDALVDENGEVPKMPVVSYRSAFDKVQEIYKSLEAPKRPPGRPKASV